MKVITANLDYLEETAKIFNHYLVFYQQPSNIEAAQNFIKERLELKDSTIFLVKNNEDIIGFIQLFPSFSSVSMKRIWILNDLFVEPAYRNQGVAKLLVNTAKNFARKTEAVRIILATQIDNLPAQNLYKSLGFNQDESFYHYILSLSKSF